jgi:CheY-like chemotaxis protein
MKIKTPKYKYGNVMLLDDSELDNFINEKMIKSSHFAEKIYVNTNGQSAIEFLNNIEIAATEACPIYPELIFVDLNMPMMDGFQFIKNFIQDLKDKRQLPRLVILTSSVCEEDRIRAIEIAPDIIFLHKPLTETMLKEL